MRVFGIIGLVCIKVLSFVGTFCYNSNMKKPKLNTKKVTKAKIAMIALPTIIIGWISPQIYGYYNQFSNTIKLRNDLNRDIRLGGIYQNGQDYVIQHEWSHFVWRKRMSSTARNLYCEALGRTHYYPTAYSKTNCAENFAEVYTGIKLGTIEYNHSLYQHRAALNAIQRFVEYEDAEPYLKKRIKR